MSNGNNLITYSLYFIIYTEKEGDMYNNYKYTIFMSIEM